MDWIEFLYANRVVNDGPQLLGQRHLELGLHRCKRRPRYTVHVRHRCAALLTVATAARIRVVQQVEMLPFAHDQKIRLHDPNWCEEGTACWSNQGATWPKRSHCRHKTGTCLDIQINAIFITLLHSAQVKWVYTGIKCPVLAIIKSVLACIGTVNCILSLSHWKCVTSLGLFGAVFGTVLACIGHYWDFKGLYWDCIAFPHCHTKNIWHLWNCLVLYSNGLGLYWDCLGLHLDCLGLYQNCNVLYWPLLRLYWPALGLSIAFSHCHTKNVWPLWSSLVPYLDFLGLYWDLTGL